MPWVYSVEPIPDYDTETGRYIPHGVKITKTLYSDSGETLVRVDSSVDEAIADSSTDLSTEYITEAAESFKAQIDILINLAINDSLPMPSEGINLGGKLAKALYDIKKFNGPVEDR